MDLKARLAELGLVLPQAPKPLATYIPAKRSGNLIYVSGQLPMVQGELTVKGPVPSATSVEDAAAAAGQCVLNMLAIIDDMLQGDWTKFVQVVRVGGFVASDNDFYGQPTVINGASNLLGEIFGKQATHARAAVGVNALPINTSVEVEFLIQVKD